jgi:Protein of unknown function (DUF1638)
MSAVLPPEARAEAPADRPATALREPGRVLVIGCGALANELVALTRRSGFSGIDVTCLPASLHNRPSEIPAAVERRIRERGAAYETVFIAYADCGTGGRLDAVLEGTGIERIPGAHCYEFYAGSADFERLFDEEPGSFYLTDYLARNFERLVIAGLGLDRHPELLPTYFGNYRRVVYLSQTDDPATFAAARAAATRLGLEFHHRPTGFGGLGTAIAGLAATTGSGATGARPTTTPAATLRRSD